LRCPRETHLLVGCAHKVRVTEICGPQTAGMFHSNERKFLSPSTSTFLPEARTGVTFGEGQRSGRRTARGRHYILRDGEAIEEPDYGNGGALSPDIPANRFSNEGCDVIHDVPDRPDTYYRFPLGHNSIEGWLRFWAPR